MDAGHLEQPDSSFDLVSCGFAIHIVADPYAVLAGIVRVLRPGGTLALEP